MMGYKNWAKAGPHDPLKNGLKYLGNYPPKKQEEFMTSPNWTRAIFVRDPKSRLLSGYMDKALGDERYVWRHCCKQLPLIKSTLIKKQCMILNEIGESKPLPTPDQFPLAMFLKGFVRQCRDQHWNQQFYRINPANWEFVNFIGSFENLARDAKCLLHKIGAWEEYGKFGWGGDLNNSIFERNTAHHKTSSKSHTSKFYTPQVLPLVYNYLRPDYEFELFNFTKPADYASYSRARPRPRTLVKKSFTAAQKKFTVTSFFTRSDRSSPIIGTRETLQRNTKS
jgi:hypothetical protein